MVTRSGVQGDVYGKNIVIFVEPEETIDPTEFDAEGEDESEDD